MPRAQRSEPDPRLVDLGLRVRQLRVVRRLSQEQLAHDAGLHRTVVGAIERGKHDFGVLKVWSLAEALNVSAADLFSRHLRSDSDATGNRTTDR